MKFFFPLKKRYVSPHPSDALAEGVGESEEGTAVRRAVCDEEVGAHVESAIKNIANTLIIKRPEMIALPVQFVAEWSSYAPRFGDTSRYGMLVQSLDIAQAAAVLADGSLFTGLDSSETRRLNEPRYRYAAMLAGLFSNIPLLASSRVTWGNAVWASTNEPLSLFARRHGNFGVTWPSPFVVNRDAGLWIVSRHMPTVAFDYLLEADYSILYAMLSAIAPEKPVSRLQQVVSTSIERVIRYAKSNEIIPSASFAKPSLPKTAPDRQAPLVRASRTRRLENGPDAATMPASSQADDLLARMGEAAASVLRALAEDAENKPDIAGQMKRTSAGLDIPIAVLAAYGVPGGAITAGLQRAGGLCGKTRTHLTLCSAVADIFFRVSE